MNFLRLEAAYKNVPFPLREFVAVVERDTREMKYRPLFQVRLSHFASGGWRSNGIAFTARDKRPAVVAPGFHSIEFVAVFDFPEVIGSRNRKDRVRISET